MGTQQHPLRGPPSSSVPLADAAFRSLEPSGANGAVYLVKLNYKLAAAPKVVEIHPQSRSFRFLFPDGTVVQGKPWVLVSNDHSLPSNAFAGALVHSATSHLWSAMIERLNQGVRLGKVFIFARSGNLGEPFRAIPSDVWPTFTVTDWETGTAVNEGADKITTIHVTIAQQPNNAKGRPPLYDQDQINGAVLRKVKQMGGLPDRNGEPGWQSNADIERLIETFLNSIQNKIPARSTLQGLAKKAILFVRDEIQKRS